MKQRIKLTESTLHRIIKESVKSVLNESFQDKYEHCQDVIEFYRGMLDSGKVKMLSQDQVRQLKEIVDFLEQTDANDNPNTKYWLDTAKEMIALDESKLHNIVRESVNKVLSEEIDLGQLDAKRDSYKKHKSKDVPEDVRKEIRKLRNMIGEYEDNGKDTTNLEKQLKSLKSKWY